ncbi:hypothetical protein ACWEQL_24645 [Kitasatospora sp. NPDC004240]
MNRLTLLAAGVVGAATLIAAPTSASAQTTATTTVCGASGLQAGLMTKVCADITGDSVQLYGQISLAGPPSPGSTLEPRELYTTLSGSVVGGSSLGTVNQGVIFKASTVKVTGVGGTVACGSTVHGSFSVASYPWNPAPVTIDVPVVC